MTVIHIINPVVKMQDAIGYRPFVQGLPQTVQILAGWIIAKMQDATGAGMILSVIMIVVEPHQQAAIILLTRENAMV